jgi:hypothetical protein
MLYDLPTEWLYAFVWFQETTVIISLFNNNVLVFITQTACVYYAVWTGFYLSHIEFISSTSSEHSLICGNKGIVLLSLCRTNIFPTLPGKMFKSFISKGKGSVVMRVIRRYEGVELQVS